MKKIKRVWLPKYTREQTVLTEEEKIDIKMLCDEFIKMQLKPEIFKKRNLDKQRYIVEIYCKWYRNFLHFIATWKDERTNVIRPMYEDKFARLEPKTKSKFYLSYFRHTGEWYDISIGQGFLFKDCLQMIFELPHFLPV